MVKVAYKAYELETKNIKTREHGNRIYKFLHQFFCEPRVPTKKRKRISPDHHDHKMGQLFSFKC